MSIFRLVDVLYVYMEKFLKGKLIKPDALPVIILALFVFGYTSLMTIMVHFLLKRHGLIHLFFH